MTLLILLDTVHLLKLNARQKKNGIRTTDKIVPHKKMRAHTHDIFFSMEKPKSQLILNVSREKRECGQTFNVYWFSGWRWCEHDKFTNNAIFQKPNTDNDVLPLKSRGKLLQFVIQIFIRIKFMVNIFVGCDRRTRFHSNAQKFEKFINKLHN